MPNTQLLRFQLADKIRKQEIDPSDILVILFTLAHTEPGDFRRHMLTPLLSKYSFLHAYLEEYVS